MDVKHCREVLDGGTAPIGQPGEEAVRSGDEVDETGIGISGLGSYDNDAGSVASTGEHGASFESVDRPILIVAWPEVISIVWQLRLSTCRRDNAVFSDNQLDDGNRIDLEGDLVLCNQD